MIQSHLLPLADICSSTFNIERARLLEIVRSEVAFVIDSVQPAPNDRWSSQQFHQYAESLKAALLQEPSCQRKALLRMRLANTKDNVFVEHENQLASGHRQNSVA